MALEGDKVVDLELPSDIATAPMRDKFLYYDKYSTVALNMAINAFFDIEFKQYYLAGYELGVQKKDIVTAFIVSRGLFSTDYFDALHKRIYRQSQQTLDKLVEKGLLKGKGGEGEDLLLDLAEDNVRMLVILDRTGVFGD